MKGVDIRTVQKLLGHHSIKMTEKYSHLAPDHLQSVANYLDSEKGAEIFGHKLGTNRISFTPEFLQVVDIKKRPQLDDFRTSVMRLGESIPDASPLLVGV